MQLSSWCSPIQVATHSIHAQLSSHHHLLLTPALAPLPPLQVVGLINIQWAIQDDLPYIIEANPRASRTVPFVAKAIGHPIAKYASLVMSGMTLADINFTEEPHPENVSVKEVVLPFNKFAGGWAVQGGCAHARG